MLAHDVAGAGAVLGQERLEQVRLVVDCVAEAGQASSTRYQMRREWVK